MPGFQKIDPTEHMIDPSIKIGSTEHMIDPFREIQDWIRERVDFIWKDWMSYPDIDSLIAADKEWKQRKYPYKLPNGEYFYGSSADFLQEKQRIKGEMYP